MRLNKEDIFIKGFMGTDYSLAAREIKTIGQFREWLQKVIDDLPSKDYDEHRVSEVSLHDQQLGYTLEEAIFFGND